MSKKLVYVLMVYTVVTCGMDRLQFFKQNMHAVETPKGDLLLDRYWGNIDYQCFIKIIDDYATDEHNDRPLANYLTYKQPFIKSIVSFFLRPSCGEIKKISKDLNKLRHVIDDSIVEIINSGSVVIYNNYYDLTSDDKQWWPDKIVERSVERSLFIQHLSKRLVDSIDYLEDNIHLFSADYLRSYKIISMNDIVKFFRTTESLFVYEELLGTNDLIGKGKHTHLTLRLVFLLRMLGCKMEEKSKS